MCQLLFLSCFHQTKSASFIVNCLFLLFLINQYIFKTKQVNQKRLVPTLFKIFKLCQIVIFSLLVSNNISRLKILCIQRNVYKDSEL